MSQYPPGQNPQYPQQPQGYPQQYPPQVPGYPPQVPGYGPQYGQVPPPQSTSGAAIASLVCSLLGCIPVLMSLIAIVLGFVGIKSTGNPNVRGRGMAVAGLILGFLGLIGWIGFGGMMYYGWQEAKKQMAAEAKPFVEAVLAGDTTKAMGYTAMSPAEVQSLSDQMRGWGTLDDLSLGGFNMKKSGEVNNLVIEGKAKFSQAGNKDFEIVLGGNESDGKAKIIGVHFK
jgi:hypothetical protein